MIDYSDNIQRIQDAIFNNPGPATGVGGWTPHHRDGQRVMRTNQRPDGSETRRKDKMVLEYMPNGSLFLHYNGGSFESCDLWTYLSNRYGTGKDNKRLFGILADLYGINFNGTAQTAPRVKVPSKATKQALKPVPIVEDETAVNFIPDELVDRTINYDREDILRHFLNGFFDPSVLQWDWSLYGVGITRDGHPIFWNYDQEGRCRTGKIMHYRPDGHRDKEDQFSICAAHTPLKKAGLLPQDWEAKDCLFGEHLLHRYPEKAVGLVESEKTALICDAVFPKFTWIATGGSGKNLDRAKAVLNGRRVTVFPDADAAQKWEDAFKGIPGWTISQIALNTAQERGPEWAKCDLADILIEEYTSTKITA